MQAASSPQAPSTAAPGPTLAPLPARPSPSGQAIPGSVLTLVPPNADRVEQYASLELDVLAGASPVNPFDTSEFEIRVEFVSPSGAVADVGAFWYQAYDRHLIARGDPGWKVRFTPTEVGLWTATARLRQRDLSSDPIEFRVVPSDRPGFVRIHPANPRYLAFDDGSTFFPIGLNLGWWSGAGSALTDYPKWLDPFTSAGGNAVRIWMADWSFGLESWDTPLGDYRNRLAEAWLLDQVVAMAEARDVYVILVLLTSADFNDWQTNGWRSNPYNAARGGPLARPEDFVTDPEARAFFQRRLNYIVNRWGHSPHLLAWEWWNEVNLASIGDETLIPWLEEMTAYLRARDVNRHLTTNSYAIRYLSPIWDLPGLDIIQRHEYADQVRSPPRDLAGRVQQDLRLLESSAPAKPILLGEFGYSATPGGDDVEKTGIHLHNGLWSTAFAGYAGSAMYWWWDVYVEANHLWHHFRYLDRFLRGIDPAAYNPVGPPTVHASQSSGSVVGLALRGPDILVWVRSDGYTVEAAEAARARAGSSSGTVYLPPPRRGLSLSLSDVEEGEYTIRWYDPQRGRWMDPVVAAASGNHLTIPVPEFRADLAARITRRP